jgi:hypothetical protein
MVQTFQTSALLGNDLVLDASGNLVMLTGVEAIAQACTNACLTQYGECVLETGEGLPNFQLIWNGVPDYALWQSYLQNTLFGVPGVTGVQSIKLTMNNGVLSYAAQINTQYGPTSVTGNIGA